MQLFWYILKQYDEIAQKDDFNSLIPATNYITFGHKLLRGEDQRMFGVQVPIQNELSILTTFSVYTILITILKGNTLTQK